MAQSSAYNLPDRWVNCPRKGQLIEDKFLPFKTPLSAHYDESLEERDRFPPSLLHSISQNLPRPLGMIVDLTNSQRFYSPEAFNQIGLQHAKIPCEGHRKPPTREQSQAFIQLSHQFLSAHSQESIGVHCTHGFNRTGFLIVCYLVEREDWGLSAAIQAFSAGRGPGIYKQNYLQELYRRYGDGEHESLPRAPERPGWCALSRPDLELEISSTESDSSGEEEGQRGRAAGVSGDVLEEVPSISALTNGDTHQGLTASQLIHRICQLCGYKEGAHHTFPGSQPVTLDHVRMESYLPANKYYVSWKADGTRYMMYIRGPGQVYLLRRDGRVFPVQGVTFPHRKPGAGQEHVTETLLDCEMVIENRPKLGRRPYLLIYDLVAYAGDNKFGMMRHSERVRILKKDIYEPREKAALDQRIDKSKEPFSVKLKEFFPLNQIDSVYNEFIPKLHHEIDGLIFSMDNQGYIPGRCEWLLKWKPLSLNSMDFRLKIVKLTAREGELGGKRYHFMVMEDGTRLEKKFFEFEQKDIKKNEFKLEELDKKIIECTLEGMYIKILRIRTDKTKPNTWSTAANVWSSIRHPLTIEELIEFINKIPNSQTHAITTTTHPTQHNHRPTNSVAPPPNSNSHGHDPPHNPRPESNHVAKRHKVASNHSQISEPNLKRQKLDSSESD